MHLLVRFTSIGFVTIKEESNYFGDDATKVGDATDGVTCA